MVKRIEKIVRFFFWSSSLDVARKPSLNALFVCQISYSSEDNLSNILKDDQQESVCVRKCLKESKAVLTVAGL